MKTTTIGRLTIHRMDPGEEMPDHLAGESPGRLYMNRVPTDELILAQIECMKLYDDEEGSEYAAATHTVVVPSGGCPGSGNELLLPADACVAKKARSIRARQDAIAAGVASPDTPLVGNPVPTRVLAPDPV